MKLGEMLQQVKLGSELAVKCVGVITDNVEAAALGRPFGTESCNDDMAARVDRVCYVTHIRSTVVTLR